MPKKTLHFFNTSGELDNIIQFLENIQKKVDYINLNATVEGKDIKIVLSGPRDVQVLATERIKALAEQFLE
ncbi:MAG: hypothetical protein BAJALOKI2v1_200007 [Promethearchaeota archaeon]|nr:MAG: hypothetical protein BAJALOKI2v1_200007 [Candidatus Lokiarchaeota archaeon]